MKLTNRVKNLEDSIKELQIEYSNEQLSLWINNIIKRLIQIETMIESYPLLLENVTTLIRNNNNINERLCQIEISLEKEIAALIDTEVK